MIAKVIERLTNLYFGVAERERLGQNIDGTWSDFEDQIQRSNGKALESWWARSVIRNLLEAEQKHVAWNIERGWTSVLAAQRAMLFNPEDSKRLRDAAIALRREADKVTGWRAKAISDLICGEKGELLPNIEEEPQRVVDAIYLRDDFSQNNYFKIALRRRHLAWLWVVLWIGIATCLIASHLKRLPTFYNDTHQLGLVIVFGILGACLSVGQGLLSTELSARIPAQQIGAFAIWTRPAIGAAAALAALAILEANSTVKFLSVAASSPNVVGLLAFAAGYSERFIVGAIEKVSSIKKPD